MLLYHATSRYVYPLFRLIPLFLILFFNFRRQLRIDPFSRNLRYNSAVIKKQQDRTAIRKGNNMKNDLTELVFILDMSGSMEHLTDDTVGGFNSVLKEHADKESEVLVTTYLFNNDSRMLHDRIPIRNVQPLTSADYRAAGCTALIDALGEAIRHIVSIHRYARPEDVPAHTVFVITTDGMENASHRFSASEVRRMVKHEQEKYGWEFVFLAANIDAVETAELYGIGRDRAVNYMPDSIGTANVYETVSKAVRSVRVGRPLCEDASWRENADRDFQKRRK